MSSIRRIPAASLRTGMYLHKIGGSWLSHPFLRNSFLLVNPEEVRRIVEAGIDSVWIDESRGDALQDVEAIGEAPYANATDAGTGRPDLPETGASSAPATAALRARATAGDVPLEAELARARDICLAGKAQVEEMFAELRLGKTVSQESVLPLVDEIAASVWRNPAALISVARLKTHDDYSYLHSVAVSALMLALARQLKLDERLVRIAGMGIYPVGSLVRLASERLAVILEPGVDSLLKPTVRAFYSIRSREKILPQTIDLAAGDCRDSIVSPESPEQWGLGNLEALWL